MVAQGGPAGQGAAAPGAVAGAAPGAIVVARVAPREFRVTASGLWTPDYVDAHFGGLEAVLAGARAGGGVRVLVDLRAAAVQTATTAERVKHWTGTIYAAPDRVAMLVASSLVKMQMRRVGVIATRELFLEEPAALAWLRSSAPA